LNDAAFQVLGARLLANAAETLAAWLPKGRRQGREWCVGSLAGEPGQSLKVNIDSGRWQDFATGAKGGDLVSLYAALHGVNQGEALQQLGGIEAPIVRPNGHAHSEPTPDPEPPALTRPPPDVDLSPARFTHSRHGAPAHVYVYRSLEGEPLHTVCRYHTSTGKEVSPWTWDGAQWRAKGPPKPRPLYGLERTETLQGRIVVVEGEKAAEALQSQLSRSAVVTWSGGANNWKHANWAPLAARSVLLWPDADPPGVAAAVGIAAVLVEIQCAVEIIDTDGLPDGYDAADLVESGAVGKQINDFLKPRMRAVTRYGQKPPKEPQRVESPSEVPRGTPATPRAYEIAERYGLASGRGGIVNSMGNVTRLLEGMIRDGTWPELWWDEFLNRRVAAHGEWTDQDDELLLYAVHNQLGLHQLTRQNVEMATSVYAHQHRRNSALDWLMSLKWDGLTRLERLLPDGFGTGATPYTMAVGRCFIMGMVARVLKPGCQLDNLPVFEGPQGARKSQAMRVLGGAWHAEVHEDIRNKDFYLSLAGKMLVEISEFQSFKRGDIEQIKAVITRPTDRYRVPFARAAADHPRQCAFAATTNNYRWNVDPTGARRFWPVRCGEIEVEWIIASREALFAEAVHLVQLGHSWWDVPEEEANAEQRKRYNIDAIERPLKLYCMTKHCVTLSQILDEALGLEKSQRYDTLLSGRVIALLTRWGWREGTYTDTDSRQYEGFISPSYVPPADSLP
jgi:hypothetical protein